MVPHLPACVTVSKRRNPGPGSGKPQHCDWTVVVVVPGTVVVVVASVVVVVATVVVVLPIGIGSVGSVIVGIGAWAVCTPVLLGWPELPPRAAKIGAAATRETPRAART
jgi:hypothetical protein